MFRNLLYLLPVLFFAACVNPPEFPNEPVLTFEGLNKAQIYQFTNWPLDSIPTVSDTHLTLPTIYYV